MTTDDKLRRLEDLLAIIATGDEGREDRPAVPRAVAEARELAHELRVWWQQRCDEEASYHGSSIKRPK